MMPQNLKKYSTKHNKQNILSKIHVIVDDRETTSGVVEALDVFEEVEVSIQRLRLGDYEVDDKLLFERKTLLDLTVSIKDGRLFRQAGQLASCPMRSVIILEGTATDLASSGMRREAIQGALITLSIFLGIPIIRSKSPMESAHLMLYAARQLRSFKAGALPRAGIRPKGRRKSQLHILQGLPGVGPERAQRLLDTFGSVEAVFTANIDELISVSGIGTTTAESIRWLVKEDEPQYFLYDDDPIL